MADRPIIFSAPMVRALLDGRKTQTRRVLKPPYGTLEYMPDRTWRPICTKFFKGDRLWVREAIGQRKASFLGIESTNGVMEAFYLADDEDVVESAGFNLCPWWRGKGSLSPIHMPRLASRLTLTVTDVRVQQLQDISEADCAAEGILRTDSGHFDYHEHAEIRFTTALGAYRDLWNSLHGPDAWAANPWVIALTFTVSKCNIDTPAGERGEG
jgi:hypothetical protein